MYSLTSFFLYDTEFPRCLVPGSLINTFKLEVRPQDSPQVSGPAYDRHLDELLPVYPPTPARFTERKYGSPSSPPISSAPAMPSSPPRKVVTDFAAFGASPTASVFGTAVQSTPFSLAGGKAAFGTIRNAGATRAGFDDEDEDDDASASSGRQKVELREGSITLEQVRMKTNFFLTGRLIGYRLDESPCKAPGEVPVEFLQ